MHSDWLKSATRLATFNHYALFEIRDLRSENTHHRGKYHCTADLLFDWFGFNQKSKAHDANAT